MIGSGTSQIMGLVNTQITKLDNWIEDFIQHKLGRVDPWMQQQAKEKLDKYKELLRTGGGNCPYSGQYIPPKESNRPTTTSTTNT